MIKWSKIGWAIENGEVILRGADPEGPTRVYIMRHKSGGYGYLQARLSTRTVWGFRTIAAAKLAWEFQYG